MKITVFGRRCGEVGEVLHLAGLVRASFSAYWPPTPLPSGGEIEGAGLQIWKWSGMGIYLEELVCGL